MKHILGLDLGTNSIGWALISEINEQREILGLGSRIIPISQDILGEFEKGNSISQTAERTRLRGVRRLRERQLLRRERMHRVLSILNFLPEHYINQIDPNTGKFIPNAEPKLVYKQSNDKDKPEFLFSQSFNEMLNDFKSHHPDFIKDGQKIPYDWTIYYLRKKALTKKIEKEELAWILLNFNQKRGYYQLRGEDDEDETRTPQTRIYFTSETIENITDTTETYKGNKVLKISLSNGETGKYFNKTIPDWIGIKKNIIVTVDIDKDGNDKMDKDGSVSKRFSIPTEEDWEKKWKLIKIKTEKEINDSRKTVGVYIYDALLQNPKQKIIGKLVRTIERKFYKHELELILNRQKEFHPELYNNDLYTKCVENLYGKNDAHRMSLSSRDFTHLFLNDIIFFQRPLKSKKSLISNCQYEKRTYIEPITGERKVQPLKGIAKSHPLFQEFRMWQFLKNIKIYARERIVDGRILYDFDITNELIQNEDDWVALFDWLNEKKEIDQKGFFKYPGFNLKKDADKYRWNYVEDKIYPCNETRWQIQSKLAKIQNLPNDFLTNEKETELWHILYSVEDRKELEKALATFANRYRLDNSFVEVFKKFPSFDKEYAAYSYKALKKLLSLMRKGKYWNNSEINSIVRHRLESIMQRLESINFDEKRIDSVADDDTPKQVLKSFICCNDFYSGLNTYQACYAIYGRHSEAADLKYWKTPGQIEDFLKNEFRQHSLRNPIVEQVITETLRVVKDIWKHYGQGKPEFFNEIHIELGREMKNPADERKKMTTRITANENTNLRIKALLIEMMNDKTIEDVRPYSPNQQEILKIYEEGVLNGNHDVPDDIQKISRLAQPSHSELIKYKLWLDQKYRSPYTGNIIPLSKLFTPAYEIEHIIPQSRYFDDSFSNKVICEAEVNKDKDAATAYEYMKNNSGKKLEISFGKVVTLLTLQAYEDFVKQNYAQNRSKMKKLLMEDIPDSFIERQLNDTRYISKAVKSLLSNLVREENELEATSKNVISSNGNITGILKQDWGLNEVWNEIITPRFERLNQLTQSNNFGQYEIKNGKRVFQTQLPLELQKGFNKKRIDHRHHALDALVIACASRNHINYLNNEYALGSKKDIRFDLRSKLCYKKYENNGASSYKWAFKLPWESFVPDAREKVLSMIISFKQNLRVINKTINRYYKWQVDENGHRKKVVVKQTKGNNWAIRKPLHKDTVSGIVNLQFTKKVALSAAIENADAIADRKLKIKIKQLLAVNSDKKIILKYFKDRDYQWNDIDISKVEIICYDSDNAASRVKLDETFNLEKIESITDSGIRKILFNHLNQTKYSDQLDEKGKPIPPEKLAFSPEGIEELNKNIEKYNEGRFHQPIYKVRTYEPKGNKFAVGSIGNKKLKYVEAAKGTNLFFAIYADEKGKRSFDTIGLNIVIERMKNGLPPVPEKNSKGDKLLFHLSPNDLVYVPMPDEVSNKKIVDLNKITCENALKIYKTVSFTGIQCMFIQNHVSNPIVNKFEFSPLNKMERSIEGIMIKDHCWKLQVDRIGNITGIIK